MTRLPRSNARALQRGQGLIEYSVVTLLVVVVLVARPNVILELVESVRKAYEAFTYAISLSWI